MSSRQHVQDQGKNAKKAKVVENLEEKVVTREFVWLIVWWVATFTLAMVYLKISSLVSWLSPILLSILFSTLFCIGYGCSAYFRCATAIFWIHCLSKPGLAMIWIASTWISIMGSMETIINTHDELSADACKEDEQGEVDEHNEIVDYAFLKSVVVYFHHLVVIPFLCIFIHSLFYIITYIVRQQSRKPASDRRATPNVKDVICNSLSELSTHLLAFIVGIFLTSSLGLYYFESVNFGTTIAAVKKPECISHLMAQRDSSDLWRFGVTTAIVIVLVPFFRLLIKMRKTVIKDYFDVSSESPVPKPTNVGVLRNDEQIVLYRQAKAQKSHVVITMPATLNEELPLNVTASRVPQHVDVIQETNALVHNANTEHGNGIVYRHGSEKSLPLEDLMDEE